MPSPSVHVTPEDLDKAVAAGNDVLSGTRATIARLNNQIEMMKATFVGQAAAMFGQQHIAWNQQMAKLVAELERIVNAANASAARQRQLEADSVNIVRNVGDPGTLA